MRFSLQTREIIADSIETVTCAQHHDANISIPGCDKNMPGVSMTFGVHGDGHIIHVIYDIQATNTNTEIGHYGCCTSQQTIRYDLWRSVHKLLNISEV